MRTFTRARCARRTKLPLVMAEDGAAVLHGPGGSAPLIYARPVYEASGASVGYPALAWHDCSPRHMGLAAAAARHTAVGVHHW